MEISSVFRNGERRRKFREISHHVEENGSRSLTVYFTFRRKSVSDNLGFSFTFHLFRVAFMDRDGDPQAPFEPWAALKITSESLLCEVRLCLQVSPMVTVNKVKAAKSRTTCPM
jgi:hypothetical protein